MLSVVLNKMLPKILSQDSNYDEWCEQEILNAYTEAAECDEYLFGDYDYCKEWVGISTQIEESNLLFFMSKNQINKEELKVRVFKLKNKLYQEHIRPEMDMKGLAHKYLNEVLDIIDEYRY